MAKSYDELIAEANGRKPNPLPYGNLLAMAPAPLPPEGNTGGASGEWGTDEASQQMLAEAEQVQPTPEKSPEQTKADIASIVQRLSSKKSTRQPTASPVEALTSAEPKAAATELDYLKQFKDAQQQAKEQTALANVMDASQGFLKSGLMWGGVSPDEANKVITNEGYQRMREQAAKAPEAVTAQMGVESAASKLQEEKESKDPSSEVSIRYRDIAKQAGINVPENATAASLEKTLPWLFKAKEANLDRQLKQQELELKKQEVAAKIKENASKGLITKGQEALDKKTAAEYSKWTADAPKLYGNIQQLKQSIAELNKLKNQSTISGPIIGSSLTPDVLRKLINSKSVTIQQDIDRITTENLRPILGAQFTEKEGSLIRSLSYDPSLEPEDNIKKLEKGLSDLESLAKQKQDQMDYYENNNMSLRGYKAPKLEGASSEESGKTVAKKFYSASRNQTKIVYSDGSEEIKEGKQ